MIGRLSAAALLSVVLAGCSGTEVKGIVRDEDSGQPLPGAVVRFGDESTRTGPGGFYELEVDLEEDEAAQVMVGMSGYEPKSMLVTIDEDQDVIYNDIELTKQRTTQEKKDREALRQFREQRQARRDLDAAAEKLQRAEQSVEEAEQNVEEAEQQQQQQQPEEAVRQPEEAVRQLDEAGQQLDEAGQQLDEAEQQLDSPEEQYSPEQQIDRGE